MTSRLHKAPKWRSTKRGQFENRPLFTLFSDTFSNTITFSCVIDDKSVKNNTNILFSILIFTMAFVKTYGRSEYRLLDSKSKLKSDNMRNRKVFTDSSNDDSPTDPFDLLLNGYNIDKTRKDKNIEMKKTKYNDENYDFNSSGDSECEFKIHKRDIIKKDNFSPAKPFQNKTNFTSKKKLKKEIIPKDNLRKPKTEIYPDFSLIEKTDLIIEDEFPSATKLKKTQKIIPNSPSSSLKRDFQTSKPKTRKRAVLNWTPSPSPIPHSKTKQKTQLITTSTPQNHIFKPQTSIPKISPIIDTNSILHLELSRRQNEDYSLQQCVVRLEKINSSLMKQITEKVPVDNLSSLSKTFRKMSPFDGSEKKKAKGKDGKRSFSPSCDDVVKVCGSSRKVARFTRKLSGIAASFKSSMMNSRRTSIMVSLTPLDISDDGQSICWFKTVLIHCNQDVPLSFYKYAESVTNICKIGEGSYGEVYKGLNTQRDVIVIKVQAITREKQLMFDAVWPEIVCACRLSELNYDDRNSTSTFVRVNGIVCVKGVYPKQFLKAWDVYDREMTSENDRPSFYNENQHYVCYEIFDGGCDLEKYQINNCLQAMSIFLQVASALAVAECALKFEHRDLHWGNILVAHSLKENVEFRLDGSEMKIATHNVVATIIDYSLSRIEEDGCTLYNDLNNADGLFSGKGDYQFDIYRKMKDVTKDSWKGFHPYTNILWLHYLLDKLCNEKTYKSRRRVHNNAVEQMKIWEREILKFSSAREFVEENKKFFCV